MLKTQGFIKSGLSGFGTELFIIKNKMALLIYIFSLLSQIFVTGLSTFSHVSPQQLQSVLCAVCEAKY